MRWSEGASRNDVWDELGMREMGDWMGWLLGGGGGGGGQRGMEQSAAAGVQHRGGIVVRADRNGYGMKDFVVGCAHRLPL